VDAPPLPLAVHDLDAEHLPQLVAQPVGGGEVARALRLDPLREDALDAREVDAARVARHPRELVLEVARVAARDGARKVRIARVKVVATAAAAAAAPVVVAAAPVVVAAAATTAPVVVAATPVVAAVAVPRARPVAIAVARLLALLAVVLRVRVVRGRVALLLLLLLAVALCAGIRSEACERRMADWAALPAWCGTEPRRGVPSSESSRLDFFFLLPRSSSSSSSSSFFEDFFGLLR